MMTAFEHSVRATSLSFAVLSTATATALLAACVSLSHPVGIWTHHHTVRHIVAAIALADILASLTWVTAQTGQLFGGDSTTMCAFEGLGGMIAFASMSLWTCVLARYLNWALSHPGQPASGPSALTHITVWGSSCIFALLNAPQHVASCGPGREQHDATPPFQIAAQVTWIAVYVVGPTMVLFYLVALYSCTHLQFRRMARHTADASMLIRDASVSDSLATDAAGAARAAGRLTFALNARLLSYLLAYIVCELPALPAAFFDMRGMSSNDVATYDSGFSVLVAVRMLLPPLQGTANALAYVHHARPCERARWLYHRSINITTSSQREAA